MSNLSRQAVIGLVHGALVARVSVLLGQSGFDHLLAVQEHAASALAAAAGHGGSDSEASYALAQAVLEAFELDADYYAASDTAFIVSESLASAGLVLAHLIAGHENDGPAKWKREVVPALDRVAQFVVSVFDGSWRQTHSGMNLRRWMEQS